PRQAGPANPLPYRGVGTHPNGSVTLAVQERFALVKDLEKVPPMDTLGPTVLDSITLTAQDWAALAPPPAATPDTKWTLPEAVARQFYPILSPSDTSFRDPKEVTAVTFTGQVQKVEKGLATLQFAGKIAGVHHGTKNEAKLGNKVSAEATLIGGVAV